MTQIPLHLEVRSEASLKNYSAGPNREAVEAVDKLVRGSFGPLLALWGRSGTGKTHLLEAAVRLCGELGLAACFLPMTHCEDLCPSVLTGLEVLDLIAVDDIDLIAGERVWETALFDFYNRIETVPTRLLFASTRHATASGFELRDLSSRLSSSPGFQLRELNDTQRLIAIQRRAHERGYQLSDEVCEFVLKRSPRDMHSLSALLTSIEEITLREKRVATIPLVRRLFENN